jgi:hypothetical protein
VETIARVDKVRAVRTDSGKTRYVLTDSEGREYTTFRPAIGERALALEGKQARIEYHEEQRGQYLNVYLDAVEPQEGEHGGAADGADEEVEEVAWKTAIDAAPWLIGSDAPKKAIPPEEFFDRIKPFKELVSEDIREAEDDRQNSTEGG